MFIHSPRHCPTMDSLKQHCLTLDSWTKHSPTIGQLNTQLTRHRTVWHSIDKPLDCWTRHCPTIGQFERALSDLRTVGHSTVRPSDSWTKAHSDHWTVGHSAHQPSDSWTQHWPTIGLLDTALSEHLHKLLPNNRTIGQITRVFQAQTVRRKTICPIYLTDPV